MVTLHEGPNQTKATTLPGFFKEMNNLPEGPKGFSAIECPPDGELDKRQSAVVKLFALWNTGLQGLTVGADKTPLFKPVHYPQPGEPDRHFDLCDLQIANGQLSQLAHPNDPSFNEALTDPQTGMVAVLGNLFNGVNNTGRPRDILNLGIKIARPTDKGVPLMKIEDYKGVRKPLLQDRVDTSNGQILKARNNVLASAVLTRYQELGKAEVVPAILNSMSTALTILKVQNPHFFGEQINKSLVILGKAADQIKAGKFKVEYVADEVAAFALKLSGGAFKTPQELQKGIQDFAKELEVVA